MPISSSTTVAPSTTTTVTPTTMTTPSTTTIAIPTTSTTYPSTTPPSSTVTEVSTTLNMTPTTTLTSSATAPPKTTNTSPTTTTPSTTKNDVYTMTTMTPTPMATSSETTTASPTTTTTPSTTTTDVSTTTTMTPTTMPTFSTSTTPHSTTTTQASTTSLIPINMPASSASAASTTTPSSSTSSVTPTTIPTSSISTTQPSTMTTQASTTTLTPTIMPTSLSTTSTNPTTFSAATTPQYSTTASDISTTTNMNPTTMPTSSATTVAPSTTTTVTPTTMTTPSTTTIAIPTTSTNYPSTTPPSSTVTEVSTTLNMTPTTRLTSSATAPPKTTNTSPTTTTPSTTKTDVYTMTTMTPTPMATSSETTTASPTTTTQSATTTQVSTTTITPTTLPTYSATAPSKTIPSSTTTTITPTTMPTSSATTTIPTTTSTATTTSQNFTTTTEISTTTTMDPRKMPTSSATTAAPSTTTTVSSATIPTPSTTTTAFPTTTTTSPTTTPRSTSTTEVSTTTTMTPTTMLTLSTSTTPPSTTTTQVSTTSVIITSTPKFSATMTASPTTTTDSTTTPSATTTEVSTTTTTTPTTMSTTSASTTPPSTTAIKVSTTTLTPTAMPTSSESTTGPPISTTPLSTTTTIIPITILTSSTSTTQPSSTTTEVSTITSMTPTTMPTSSTSTTPPSTTTTQDSTKTITQTTPPTTTSTQVSTTIITSKLMPKSSSTTTTPPTTSTATTTTTTMTPTTMPTSSTSTTLPSTTTTQDSTTTITPTTSATTTALPSTSTATTTPQYSTTTTEIFTTTMNPTTMSTTTASTTPPSTTTTQGSTTTITPTTMPTSSETAPSTATPSSTTTPITPTTMPTSSTSTTPPSTMITQVSTTTNPTIMPTSSTFITPPSTTAFKDSTTTLSPPAMPTSSENTTGPPSTTTPSSKTTIIIPTTIRTSSTSTTPPSTTTTEVSTTTITQTIMPTSSGTTTIATTTSSATTTTPQYSTTKTTEISTSTNMNPTTMPTSSTTTISPSTTTAVTPTTMPTPSTTTTALPKTSTTYPTTATPSTKMTEYSTMKAMTLTPTPTSPATTTEPPTISASTTPSTTMTEVSAITSITPTTMQTYSISTTPSSTTTTEVSTTSSTLITMPTSSANTTAPSTTSPSSTTKTTTPTTMPKSSASTTPPSTITTQFFTSITPKPKPTSSATMTASTTTTTTTDSKTTTSAIMTEISTTTTTTLLSTTTAMTSTTIPTSITPQSTTTTELYKTTITPIIMPSSSAITTTSPTTSTATTTPQYSTSTTEISTTATMNPTTMPTSSTTTTVSPTTMTISSTTAAAFSTTTANSPTTTPPSTTIPEVSKTLNMTPTTKPTSSATARPTTTNTSPTKTPPSTTMTEHSTMKTMTLTTTHTSSATTTAPPTTTSASAKTTPSTTICNFNNHNCDPNNHAYNLYNYNCTSNYYNYFSSHNSFINNQKSFYSLNYDNHSNAYILSKYNCTSSNDNNHNYFSIHTNTPNNNNLRSFYNHNSDSHYHAYILCKYSCTSNNYFTNHNFSIHSNHYSFNNSFPSEALVLSAISILQNSRESQLNESVKLVNVTYEKISETSYAVIFKFNLINISMQGDPELRSNTYQRLQNIINNVLNTLLNEPGSQVFEPKSSNFTSTSNQIEGIMEYTFQDGEVIKPVSFLNELHLLMGLTTTTVSPMTTSSFPVTALNLVSGSAVVTSKLLFNSSSPVPSEALVLSAISTLRNSRESQLNESVKLVNVTYEKISETSYAVIFTFNLINISMQGDPELRSNTYQRVQNITNNVLNTLLNEPGSQVFEPKSSNFTSTSNQIEGIMEYTFQDGEVIKPVSFLNELHLLMGLTTTTVSPMTTSSFPVTALNLVSGSAVVTSKLLFNSSSPVPSEALVLSAISTLRNSRESQLNKSVKLVNVTYEKISETSYAVIFTFNLINISMQGDPELRSNTYQRVQNITNNVLNTLLNEPGSQVFEPKSSNFTSTSNQIEGIMEYTFQDGEVIKPVSFLNELHLLMGITVRQFHFHSKTLQLYSKKNGVFCRSGSAVVTSKLLFNSSSPVPSEALVLSAISTLRNSRESQLNESVKLVNVTYEKISETSYAVIFTFNLINISMQGDPELRSNTYQRVQNITNNVLNTLLNEPGSQVFEPKSSNFTSTSNQIEGIMEYTFQDGEVIKPVSFLNELHLLMGITVRQFHFHSKTLQLYSKKNGVFCRSGSAVVTSKLLFNSSSPVPSEALVLSAISTLRNSRESQLNESVKLVNVTYEKISETSYAVIFTFNLINISMQGDPELRSNTYQRVQNITNNVLNTLLNEPGSQVFEPKSSNFTSTSNQIEGIMEYTFQDGEVIKPVSFLNELHLLMGITVRQFHFHSKTLQLYSKKNGVFCRSGSAVVTSKLLFNSSSPVPSEALVLSAISTLRNSRESQLNESVKLVNVTYEKISETSYAVIFTFNLINISMQGDPELRSNTYQRVQNITNNVLNTLLNEPGSQVFEPKSSNFTSTSNQIEGIMEYTFQDGEVIKPVSFLNELHLLMGLTTTTVSPMTTSSFPVTALNLVSGSAVVTSKLLFNSSSPVPSEALVLSAISTLRNSRESQLNESVKLVNVTYEKISETSYAVIFTFNLINISMQGDPELRSNTYQRVQNITNNVLNTLLNEPGSQVFEPKSSNFTSTSNQIEGIMEYTFQDGEVIKPVSFLNELHLLMGITVRQFHFHSKTLQLYSKKNGVFCRSGSAVVTSKLLFNSSSPVPSEALVLSAISTLRNSRESQLNESVKLVNVTYEKISETSYAVIFTFNLINISMQGDPELRSNTYQRVQNITNNVLNTLLNEPGSQVFEPKSSNFTSTSNQIEGIMEYTFQDGEVIKPVSFLNELHLLMGITVRQFHFHSKTLQLYSKKNGVFCRSGSAVVTSKLLFNSSSPVPSEALVLSAISTLRNSRESQLNESVKLVNVTYEKISETSYAVIFTFNLINISMQGDPELRSNTYQRVQNITNNVLNTLLNEPGSQVFEPKSSNFTSTSNQIEGIMEYTFQDGEVIKPVSFLNELHLLMGLTTTTVSPMTTSSFPVTALNLVSGSAVVTSKLLFNSSSPVPSEALVLSAISTLRNSRESQLNESVKLVNVTYEKISETSYAVIFTFNLINISMQGDPELRSNTYQRVQNITNNVLNTLLNEPGSQVFEPKSSNFTSTSNQIEGIMEYTFQDGEVIKPVSFLNELHLLMGLTTTTVSPMTTSSFPVTALNLVSGSAVVTSKLLFNSSSPVPSEALVLSAISTLRNSRESQLNESVKLVNVTYEKISETSYAVIFTFNLINISMQGDPELRSNTYQRVQNITNNVLNTLLNEPGSQVFEPKSSNFTSTLNEIEGIMEYTFQDGDLIQPVSFLNELRLQTGTYNQTLLNFSCLTTTKTPMTNTTSPPTLVGKAIIYIRLVFITLGPIPSESKVLELANSLLESRLRTKQSVSTRTLSDPVSFVNVTFQRISDNSYALKFGFEISNVTMTEKLELRDETYTLIQNSINTLLNQILSSPSATPFVFKRANFTGNSTVIQADVQYVFSESDIQTPSIFLQELLKVNVVTTPAPAVTSPPTVVGKAIIYIRLVFITLGPIPSESKVLELANSLLDSRLRTKRSVSTRTLSDPVSFVNVTFQRISDNSYAIKFGFEISNVTMTEKLELRDETYTLIQNSINKLLNQILSSPSATPFVFKRANFTGNSTVIQADVQYVFSESDIQTPSIFLQELLKVNVVTTPAPAVTPNTTVPNNGTSAAWVVAIIVPCAIVIILVPCWILLCCLLCGCCAAIRRRWHRRQSYNVQYTTRNSLF
ncbi:uncharacterized protein LOC127444778 [Myxocyprinus asiaticus]|uniref:uncharacterized protein LOC127444778 n=1 Tax=Myxocyprinus asiaticus TaxID=70543 RepID=UPI002221A54B|nr:uncharacterized protein LOC127444778 [Myxocyprinus asiaticus]